MKEYNLLINKNKHPYLEETGKMVADTIKITNPDTLFSFAKKINLPNQAEEKVYILAVDAKGNPLGYSMVGTGTKCMSIINPQGIFTRLLLMGATNFFVFHNHPSGDIHPSKEDLSSASNLKKLGKMMGMEMLDFLIVVNDCYASFAQNELF